MNQILGIHHLNLSVTDIERSAEWYGRVLGLEPGWTMDDIEGRGRKIVLLFPGSDLRLVLSHHQRSSNDDFSEFRTGLDHLALTVESREQLEEWDRRFTELRIDHSPIKEGATGWLITFRDPDNIQLELYSISKDGAPAT